MRYALAAFLFCVTCPASAAWNVTTTTDPLTDARHVTATVSTAGASLRVRCLNGHVTPEVVFDRPVGVSRVSMAYRFDSGPVVSHGVFLARDGRTAWPWLADVSAGFAKVHSAKRLRVQIFPPQSAPDFYDFDLTGAVEAVAKVRCR